MQKSINGATLRKMAMAGATLLEENKKFVDSLNVFPVPDGDTGTNMSLTFKSAVTSLNACLENTFSAVADSLAKGALRGARGNSGVILSQIIKGMSSVIGAVDEPTINTKTFAKAMVEGANVAYKAVTKPKEGTILTVIRCMSESAVRIAKKESDFEIFLRDVLNEGEAVLQQTPELLPVLKKAGVVDAGGRGLIVIFTGFYKVLLGEEEFNFNIEDLVSTIDKTKNNEFFINLDNLADIEFQYCTQYMISHMKKKTTESDIDKLREKLMEIGDSVVCVGDLALVKVHVHTNTPNVALGYALELGELIDIKIDNMIEQNRELKRQKTQNIENLKPLGMVAVAPGEGIANVFKDLMVDNIIEGGQTMNPSTDDIAKAVDSVPAKEVFVFPNNKNIIFAAEQAKELTNKYIHVIPTKSISEGISAALAFNPEGSVDDNIENMTNSKNNVRSASVTYAVRTTHVDGFDLTMGDIIGLNDDAILVKGNLVNDTTLNLVDKLMTDDTVNITLFYGKDVNESEANELVSKLEEKYTNCDVTLIEGNQPVYYYLISLE